MRPEGEQLGIAALTACLPPPFQPRAAPREHLPKPVVSNESEEPPANRRRLFEVDCDGKISHVGVSRLRTLCLDERTVMALKT